MLNETIPGTSISYSEADDAFSVFRPMIEITGGLSLGQVCTITGLQPSTIQNWVKRSFIPHPENKKYYERHLSRILLISALRECMNIEEIGELMVLINGDTDDESDDIISESSLYDFFCKAIRQLDRQKLSDEYIEETILKILNEKGQDHQEKLLPALKVMVYAYVSGKCLAQIEINLSRLRGESL